MQPFRSALFLALYLSFAAFFLAPAAHAANVIVTALTDTGAAGELRAAITAANASPGSLITFAPGLIGTLTLNADLPPITSTMTITGNGPTVLAISGNGAHLPFSCQAGLGTVTITDLTIKDGLGGAIVVQTGSLNVNRCSFTGNSANGGGAINCNGNTVYVTSSSFTGNNGNTAYGGGAIYLYTGNLTLLNCTLNANKVTQLASGGAIRNDYGHVTLTNCAVYGNSTEAGGGNAISNYGGNVSLTNCTVAGNTTTSGDGGAVLSSLAGAVTMMNCTVTGNTASTTGGIVSDGQVSLTNCIVYGNSGTAISAPAGVLTSLYSDIAGGLAGVGNINADPLFATAQVIDNGGPTPTIAMRAGSPCYRAGTTAGAPATDQRGLSRTNPPGMGAFDTIPTTESPVFVLTPGTYGSAQLVSITDPTPGAVIYYSTSGSTPTIGINKYSGAISVPITTTVKAIAIAPYCNQSAVVSALYTILPPPTTIAHLFLKNTSGSAAVWTVKSDWSFTSTPAYGPYGAWQARAIADGADGNARLLWTDGAGTFAVWTVNADGTYTSTAAFGPYPGWTATAVAIGGDSNTRLLLKNSNGSAAVWTLRPNGTFGTSTAAFGPYGSWQATGLAVGKDNMSKLLWKSGLSVSVWKLNLAGTLSNSSAAFGPFGAWSASAMAAGGDNNIRLLWNGGGASSVWTLDANQNMLSSTLAFGPYGAWSVSGFAVGSDSATRLLWTGSGAFAVWLLNASTYTSSPAYGPFSGWSAVAIAAP